MGIKVEIYRNTRDNKLYLLDDMTTMGGKVHMVPFCKDDDKFVSLSTLKRWYRKEREADLVIEVRAFTGMKIGCFEVEHYDRDKEIYWTWTKDHKLMAFDKHSGRQTNPNSPKFANKMGMMYGYDLFIQY